MTDEEFKVLIDHLNHIGYHEPSDIRRLYWSKAIDQLKDMHKFCLANMPVIKQVYDMILFLDFDGVLHYDDVLVRNNGPVLYRTGYTLFQWASPLIEALEPHPHIKIVLSTSWAGVFGFDKALAALPEVLRPRVIGATYTDQGWYSKTRYQQIADHVEKHQIANWIAIDDDVIGWPDDQRHTLVECSSWHGLSRLETQQELRDALTRLAA